MDKQTSPSPTLEVSREAWETLNRQVVELTAKLKWFEEQFKLNQQRRFGASSEKTPPEQLPLFNEAEQAANSQNTELVEETVTYRRQKQAGQRQKSLDQLPVEKIHYRLTAGKQVCDRCGQPLHEMTTEIRTELKVIPPEVRAVRHIRHVYACRHCEREAFDTPIVTASAPKPIYPKSLASPSAMAYTMCQKYLDSQPLYRQERQFRHLGVAISRQTLANWILYGARQWLTPLYQRLKTHLLKRDILQADETTLQVLHEPDRPATSKSYLWLYRSGRIGPPIVLYDYQTTRAGKHPARFLADFHGYLQVDGYAVENVTLVDCWAHARRKFTEALKALPVSAQASAVKAKEGLNYCNQLFTIEREMKKTNRSVEERYAIRLKKSQPVLQAFSAWLREQAPKVLPKSTLGLAINYCRDHWKMLNAFLTDGRLELDNNRAERSIKPFVIGRKNWLFSNTAKGATASATVYSIIESAKENDLHPFRYLTYPFTQLPNLEEMTDEALDKLMPWSESLPADCHLPVQK